MEKKSKFVPAQKYQIIILIVVISLFIAFGAYQFYKWETGNIRQQKEKILTAIGELKIAQIENWFRDELNDANLISRNPALLEKANSFFNNSSQFSNEGLLVYLNQIKAEHDYSDVILTSLDGKVIISTDDLFDNLNPIEKTTLKAVIDQGESLCTDLFLNENSGKPVLISFVTVGGNQNNNTPFALIMRIDPDVFLYPLVERWPIPSRTSETFICRVENDYILYLNNPRHKNIKVLDYKIPLSNTDLPAAKAAAGYKGIYSGKDYRNVDVFAYMDKIKGTPWYLISKIDKSEIFEELPLLAIYVIAFTMLSIITFGFVIAFIYNRRQKTMYAELYTKEKEIWQQQEKFKVTLDSLGEGVITLDIKGKVQYMNNLAEELTGWNLREARGRYLGDIYSVKNEETGETENNILEKILKHGIVKELANHTILISKNGKELPVIDTGAPIYDSDGTVIGIVIAFQDETEKRTQQRLLKESEDRLRSTLDNMIEGCQIIGYDFKYLFLNKSALKNSRKTSEELLGKTMMECYPGIEDTSMFSKLKSCMEERIPINFENEFTYPDGEKKFFNLKFQPVPEGIFILSEDITQRKQFEEEIIEKTAILESFFDNTLTLIALLDKGFNFIRVNKAYADADERDVDFFVGKNHFALYPSDAKEIFEEVVRTKTAYRAIERPFIYANNPERGITYWDWNLVPLLDENGEVESLIFTLLNVTERVKAKEELIKNEKFLTTLFNSVNDAIFTLTMPERTIKSINNAVSDLFGYDPGELIGKTTRVLYQSNEAFQEYGTKLSAAIKKNKQFVRAELKLQKKDSTLIFCDVQTTFLKSSGRDDLAISVFRDITEKKKMIDELIVAKEKAEEMNEVKTLFFANMSHELRTPFVGIMGYGEMLADELKDPEHKEMAQGILSTSKRMMDTLTKILSLSKLEIKDFEVKKENVNLNELFDSIHKEYFAAANKKNILLEKTIGFEDAVVQSDKSLLFDILHNLVSNAINYTDEGKISISADKKIKSNKEILVINVSDTGIGIPKDKHEIVWQEFRQVSEGKTRSYQGTGLGLTIVKKYTEQLGGQISLQSEEGKGSTFSIEFPV